MGVDRGLNNPVNLIDPSGFFFKKLFRFMLGIDRYVAPVVTGIVVGIVVTWATKGCIPCGAIAGGAVAGALSGAMNSLYYGGTARDVFMNAAVGGIIGGAAGGVGAFAGAAVGAAGGSGFASAVAGGAAGGATGGALSASVYGGDPGLSAAYGAVIGAASAAAIYGGYQAAEWLTSPALEQGGHGTPCSNCLDPSVQPAGLPRAAETPLDGTFRITTEHGGHTPGNNWHIGIDMASTPRSWPGQEVYATDAGRISGIGQYRSGATYVTLTTNQGVVVQYVHTQPLPGVGIGTPVVAGQGIGSINLSGRVTAPHLHFQVQHQGQWVNPRFYLP